MAWIAAALVCSTVAAANVPMGAWSPNSPGAAKTTQASLPGEVETLAQPALADNAKARTRSACRTCGIVETIRRYEAAGGSPAGYEFTIRLRDGSIRTSTDSSAASWLVGDSIMLIGGPKTRVQ